MLWVIVASVVLQVDGGVSQFATRVRSPLQRETAACEALRLAEPSEGDEKCAVNHVIETKGPRGKTTFIVFFRHEWGGGRPGKPIGHFEVFDEGGSHIKWFMNANVLEPTDSVLQLGKGPAVVVQRILSEASCGRATSEASALLVQTLHVVSLAEPEHPILSLFVGPPTRETYVVRKLPAKCETSTLGSTICGPTEERAPDFTWTWSVACHAASCSLSLGPMKELRDGRAAAAFHWSVPAKRVVGPPGSADGGFLKYEAADGPKAMDKFSAGHGFSTTCKNAGDKNCAEP